MDNQNQGDTEMTITHESAALIYGAIEVAVLRGTLVKELRASGYTLRDIVVLRSIISNFREAYFQSAYQVEKQKGSSQ